MPSSCPQSLSTQTNLCKCHHLALNYKALIQIRGVAVKPLCELQVTAARLGLQKQDSPAGAHACFASCTAKSATNRQGIRVEATLC